ncbi:unnamed protein product [Rodentolepis nana]|uniref:Expressed conserved protein n=1 Tax=Rodentolepis nana TaxID=102285 RepID=A0A0R3TV74_RODNA|nr:unnamed protein product [Rodentolepis nana]
MDRRIGYIIIALLSALLFFLAVGYNGWPCGGSPLSDRCKRLKLYETTGALILTAGLLALLCGIILIFALLKGGDWTEIASLVLALLAAIIGMAGVFYYYDNSAWWGPFIATVGMSLTIALAGIILFDVITSRT